MKSNAQVIDDLKKERDEVDYKLDKLTEFALSDKIDKVSSMQAGLIMVQRSIMTAYRNVLTGRMEDLSVGGYRDE